MSASVLFSIGILVTCLNIQFGSSQMELVSISVCSDKLENCRQYGKSSCRPPYDSWARDNCALYCGFCSGPPTTPVPCVDKLDCQGYGQTICSNPKYAPWVLDNCRYFCRQCSPEQLAVADSKTTTLPPPPCVDKLDNCNRYERTVCSDPQFAPWAADNCRYFCRNCTQEQLNIADSKTTTTTTEPTTVTSPPPPTTPPPCIDKVEACKDYGAEVCNNPDYAPWVLENCRYFCRKCLPEQLAIADSKTTTTPRPPCEDKISNCERYPKTVCSDPKYAPWANDNCRYYCRKCTQEELNIADSKTTTTTTTQPPCVDTMPNCKQYGTAACTNFRSWAEQNCPAYCQFCTSSGPSSTPGFVMIPMIAPNMIIRSAPNRRAVSPRPPCEDKISSCDRYLKIVCTDPKYDSWAKEHCRYHCRKCTQEELNIADSKATTIITTPPPCVDRISNCKDYSIDHCNMALLRPWAGYSCPAYCHYCTPSGPSSTPGSVSTPIILG